MYNICCNSAQIVTRFPKANPLSRMKAHFSIRQGEENFFQVQRTSNTLNVGYTHQRKHAKGNYLMMITQTDLYWKGFCCHRNRLLPSLVSLIHLWLLWKEGKGHSRRGFFYPQRFNERFNLNKMKDQSCNLLLQLGLQLPTVFYNLDKYVLNFRKIHFWI